MAAPPAEAHCAKAALSAEAHCAKAGPPAEAQWAKAGHTIAMTHAASSRAADVRAWYAQTSDLAANPALVARGRASLTPIERDRFDRFRHDEDRLMFLLGRLMARLLVGRALGIAPMAWRWREGTHGRPEIDDPHTTLRFNVAHSAGMVVCALADGRDVGVDVEDRHRHTVDREIVPRYCAPAEVADIDAQPAADWQNRFLLYWTLKEAYLKALGLGISVPLAEVSFTIDGDDARVAFLGSLAGADTRWSFHLTRPTDRHQLAVAASRADGVVPLIDIAPLPVEWIAECLRS